MNVKDFLLARIDEDEADAKDAYYEGQTWAPEEEAVVDLSREWDTVMHMPRKRDAVHASNWSPARVLAECAAKRAIIEAFDPEAPDLDPYVGVSVMCLMAGAYADHADYQKEWRNGAGS